MLQRPSPLISRKKGVRGSGIVFVLPTLICAGCQTAHPTVEFRLQDESSTPPTCPNTAHVGTWVATTPVKLAGAINETLSFAFSVTPREATVREPTILVPPLVSASGSVDASAVEIFRLHAVRLGRVPGWHIRAIPPSQRERAPLDVLVPLTAPRGGLPQAMFASQTYHFWADLHIPKGTSAGTYEGRVEVRCADRVVDSLGIELTVWPIVLPDTSPIPFIAEVNHRTLFEHHIRQRAEGGAPPEDWRGHPRAAEYDRLLTSTMRMLESHRLTPVLPDLSPSVRVGPGGAVEVIWDAYDAAVEPLLSGRSFVDRIGLSVWPVPVARLFASSAAASIGSAGPTEEFARRYLAQCIDHFATRGWLEASYVLAPVRFGERMEPAERVRLLNRVMADSESGVHLATRRFPQDLASFGWVGFQSDTPSSVDVWAPPAQFYDADAMAQERRLGRSTWMTIDRPPFSGSMSIHAPGTHARVLGWQAMQLEAAALHLGEVNHWPRDRSNPSPEDCIGEDDEVLLYPGSGFGLDAPVASVRLKNLRRSQQDAAYLRLLSEHGLGHIADGVRRELVGWAGSHAYRAHFADGGPIGWVDDPIAYDLGRRIMAAALVSEVADEEHSLSLSQTAAWRRLMSAGDRVELHVDGSRVRLSGAPPAMSAEIETQVTIVNRGRLPASGAIRFGQLPGGWSPVSSEDDTASIPLRSSRRVTLTALAIGVDSQPDGVTALPLEYIVDDGARHRQTARVAFLTATPLATPLRIDGDLSDWPPGEGNVAADFRLISGTRVADADGPDVSRPGTRTTAFVQRDRTHLYIAVSCETGSGREPPISRRKGVHYDDLIPAEDEDLIEVLIDPSNAGTRSPSDLYHIAVKKSGTDVTEKGIGTDPPCSLHQPWPVDIEVATSMLSGRWMVELRVPLAAVSPDAHDHVIWGFNVTRWDAQRQEFSTWSGALGNAYDPLSLGNIFLP